MGGEVSQFGFGKDFLPMPGEATERPVRVSFAWEHIDAVAARIPLVEELSDGQAHRTNGQTFLRIVEPKAAPNRVDFGLSHLNNLTARAVPISVEAEPLCK